MSTFNPARTGLTLARNAYTDANRDAETAKTALNDPNSQIRQDVLQQRHDAAQSALRVARKRITDEMNEAGAEINRITEHVASGDPLARHYTNIASGAPAALYAAASDSYATLPLDTLVTRARAVLDSKPSAVDAAIHVHHAELRLAREAATGPHDGEDVVSHLNRQRTSGRSELEAIVRQLREIVFANDLTTRNEIEQAIEQARKVLPNPGAEYVRQNYSFPGRAA